MLNVVGVVARDTIANSQIANTEIIKLLSAPRKRLQIADIGLVAIDTNVNPDLDLGPRIGNIKCDHMGGFLAHIVSFTIEYNMPPACASPSYLMKSGAWLAMNFSLGYTINEEGLVERRISGFAEFTQIKGKEFNLEEGWDKINFTRPEFMKRVSLDRQFSTDKKRIDFSCVDVEMSDLAYPDGIISAEVDMDLENRPPGFIQWYGQLSARLTTAPNVPRSAAASKFFVIMFDVAKKLRKAAKSAKGIVIPERIRIGGGKFSRTSRFSVTWRMAACLHDILKETGLWDAVPDTSYKKWQTSMDLAGVNGRRGASGVKWGGVDVVVGLCDAQPDRIIFGADAGQKGGYDQGPEGDLKCEEITKERSYLHFENRVRGTQSQNVLIHKVMQAAALPYVQGRDQGDASLFADVITGLTPDIMQVLGLSFNYVIMQGSALRLKYSPEIPHLEKVAGVKVREVARAVETKPETGYFDCALISARWAILYLADKPLYGVKPPNNERMCFTGGEDDGRTK